MPYPVDLINQNCASACWIIPAYFTFAQKAYNAAYVRQTLWWLVCANVVASATLSAGKFVQPATPALHHSIVINAYLMMPPFSTFKVVQFKG